MSTSSGGNPAPIDFAVLIIPKHSLAPIIQKDWFLKMQQNYIIYLDEVNNRKVIVLNLESQKSQSIELKSEPAPIKGITLFVKEVEIKSNSFKISYESVDYENDELKLVKETYALKI
ncbi:MAG: hypothetical protein EOO43_08940 [Flavobacterium sp.]|nr:MAG: hypothetical protein EOO43_08940 [Flavobacterium sp.]